MEGELENLMKDIHTLTKVYAEDERPITGISTRELYRVIRNDIKKTYKLGKGEFTTYYTKYRQEMKE